MKPVDRNAGLTKQEKSEPDRTLTLNLSRDYMQGDMCTWQSCNDHKGSGEHYKHYKH